MTMLTAIILITGLLLSSIALLGYIAHKLDSRGYGDDLAVIDYNEHNTLLERLCL